ncbi:ewing's tumor-associated antigen 1 [Salarias fasciatus]|uniref:ewing's tumor-associated antigen 1 n=1 Tax=Salarias fasciatus TaxID=181472 RepID=UPI0011767D26|nr:ewing's tumor-associated antigen 1 [Salarias fasciatus]
MSGALPPEHRCARSRASRLSRSFRMSQAAEPEPPRPVAEFRTPSRLPRCRTAESPQQDPDCQQDIVWDATSPSPRRSGNRGKNHVARGVDISEIVSRIAPKHGRPAVPEPTLQQWIGDSATIPCTPDLQAPKPRKSPRRTVVDDLLRLAKQFDLTMFRPDAPEPPLSPELLTDAALESTNHQTAVHPTEVDDLDFLFDGPTQHLSGRLSQPSQVGPSAVDVKPLPTSTASHGAEIQDDWENDHLFNDSLVLEMAHNPEMFLAPIDSSTQKPIPRTGQVRHQNSSPVKLRQSAAGTGRLSRVPGCSSDSASALRLVQTAANKENVSPGARVESVCGVSQGPDRRSEPPFTTRDFLLDDLDALFSAEPLWDDAEDDDLLCQLCEDLERQVDSNVPASNQRAAPHTPFNKPKADTTCTNYASSRGPVPTGAPVHRSTAGEPVRFKQEVSGFGRLETPRRNDGFPTSTHKDRFSFKKPNNPVSTVTNTASLRCSDAEIQMKKQQAMERRRQRLQAAPGWSRTGSLG